MALAAHVDIVEQRSELRIARAVRAREADDAPLVLRDDDELTAIRRREPGSPHLHAVLVHVAVEKFVAVSAAVGGAPALGVPRRDRLRVVGRRRTVAHRRAGSRETGLRGSPARPCRWPRCRPYPMRRGFYSASVRGSLPSHAWHMAPPSANQMKRNSDSCRRSAGREIELDGMCLRADHTNTPKN